ncbi:glycerophosphodiester phosphodiesterase family protein [Planomicrobium soli]|uniref:glycerophosphodiester phosphodiesterase family protein n=1 Tax=Planomicrobium soli TaxID=1176648 RepID=UPI0015E75337|nr:glycerophosphodiester phosphodiesterase family protein [Planomicrobium soli]
MSFAIDEGNKKISNRLPYNWTQHSLIAHAAGGIDGMVYTNSLEAFEASYQKGHRLFEIDLAITADGELIARHGWENTYGQHFNPEEGPLSYDHFMKSLYFEQYTPLDFNAVLELMERHQDAYLILDGKVSSVAETRELYRKVEAALEKTKKGLMDRLIPQLFYEGDIEVFRQLGFQDLIYVVGREDYTPESVAVFCKEHDIRVVSLSRSRTNEEFVKTLKTNQIDVYMYTFNDMEKMEPYMDMGVRGFFTDMLSPGKRKSAE